MIDYPKHWFRPVTEQELAAQEPQEIEYLKMWTGETFIHVDGTTFWQDGGCCLNVEELQIAGITHYRIIK